MHDTPVPQWLRTDEIDPPATPMRSDPGEDIEELAESVEHDGQLNPLIVRRKNDGRYELVCGHRRWLAHQRAGLTEVWGVVKELSDKGAAELRVIENQHRKPVDEFDLILSLRDMKERFRYTLKRLASCAGMSVASLSEKLSVLKLPEHIVGKYRNGKDGAFSLKHLVALAKLAGSNSHDRAEELERLTSKIELHRINKEETARLVSFVRSEGYTRLPDRVKGLLFSSPRMTARHAELLADPRERLTEETSVAASRLTDKDREQIAERVCTNGLSVTEMMVQIERLLARRAGFSAEDGEGGLEALRDQKRGDGRAAEDSVTKACAFVKTLRQGTTELLAGLQTLKAKSMYETRVPVGALEDLKASLRVLRAELDTLPLDGRSQGRTEGPC